MLASDWSEELNQTQLEYVPVITLSIAMVQILLDIRDLIIYSGTPPEHLSAINIVVTAVAILLALGVSVFRASPRIPPFYFHLALFISVAIFALRPIVSLHFIPMHVNMYFTVTIVGIAVASMFFLSRWQYVLLSIFSIAIWTSAALIYLSPSQALIVLLSCTVASGFGHLLMSKRISNLKLILELKHRVEDLESILPMCSWCKKTLNENGSWVSVEKYIESQRDGLQVSHGICGACEENMFKEQLSES